MTRLAGLLSITAALLASGCVSTQQFLDSKQPAAVQTAVQRARFDLNCPDAVGTVLSRTMVEPPPLAARLGAVDRAEFTVGVSGCERRQTYVVVCADGGDGCFAADGREPGR